MGVEGSGLASPWIPERTRNESTALVPMKLIHWLLFLMLTR